METLKQEQIPPAIITGTSLTGMRICHFKDFILTYQVTFLTRERERKVFRSSILPSETNFLLFLSDENPLPFLISLERETVMLMTILQMNLRKRMIPYQGLLQFLQSELVLWRNQFKLVLYRNPQNLPETSKFLSQPRERLAQFLFLYAWPGLASGFANSLTLFYFII